MEIQVGLSEKNRSRIAEDLGVVLSDTYAVFILTQFCHWNITGADFYTLHVLFQKQYEELFEHIDELAERIRALGFFIDASFSGFKEKTVIAEHRKTLPSRDMLKELLIAHEIIIRSCRNLSAVAEEENDPATVDLLGKKLNLHEKMAWMLRSML